MIESPPQDPHQLMTEAIKRYLTAFGQEALTERTKEATLAHAEVGGLEREAKSHWQDIAGNAHMPRPPRIQRREIDKGLKRTRRRRKKAHGA